MEIAIEKFVIISFVVVSISHIVQARAWAEFFIRVRNKGTAGSFINAWIHFPMGALIVSFHNVWHGIPMIVTIMGWGLIIKGFIYWVFPQHGLKVLQRVKVERAWEFQVAGAIMLALAGLLTYSLWSRGEVW